MITEKDIYISACGLDERGINRSLVKIETAILNINGGEQVTVDEIVLDNPTVNIFKTRAFTMIDLTFNDPLDYEFIKTGEMLSNFSVIDNTSTEEELSAICISICPKEYNGIYVITGLHAMWLLQPQKAGDKINTIRFIVENGFMHTYQFNIDSMDIDKIEEEALEEIEQGIY